MSMSRICYDWSKLPPDLLRSVFESVSIKDFHRARTVCSNWYNVSRTCKRPLYPWPILFKRNSTLLIDPLEGKTHKIDHPETDLPQSYVIASCSNWILMVDYSLDFSIMNVFTQQRINLPSIDSSKFDRTDIVRSKQSAVLWINERTGDFIVAWSYDLSLLFTYKKGEDSWKIHEDIKCFYLACKDFKLYVYTVDQFIKIFDLSGDSLNEIVEGNPYLNHQFNFVPKSGESIWKRRIAVTNSGEVLIVLSLKRLGGKDLFCVCKMDFERSNSWARVDSLGGEMVIFGYGVTIRAPIKDINDWGIKSDTICFLDGDLSEDHDEQCGVFDLGTSRVTWAQQVGDRILESRWFVPGYA